MDPQHCQIYQILPSMSICQDKVLLLNKTLKLSSFEKLLHFVRNASAQLEKISCK